ncbi:MAG: vibriobactin-specific isochorismatase [Gammaproteobacteria bacterium]|nr:MAG: vibriobactin-specific isochorismatase [Gammaproteobacteria bacterium]
MKRMSLQRIAPYVPPAGPFPGRAADWRFEADRAALLIHDMQAYFLSFYDPELPPLALVLERIAALLAAARRAGLPVFFSGQPGGLGGAERGLLQRFWGDGLPDREDAARIQPALAPLPGESVIEKRRYSAFFDTALEARLRAAGRDQLLLCGVYAHIGVCATALDAFMRDIEVFVPSDAVADFSAADHERALRQLAACCACVRPAEDFLTALGDDPLRHEVAALLGCAPEAIGEADDLLALGLDSIRLMMLAERWQAPGREVSVTAMLERPTLADWRALLTGAGEAACDG